MSLLGLGNKTIFGQVFSLYPIVGDHPASGIKKIKFLFNRVPAGLCVAFFIEIIPVISDFFPSGSVALAII